jgi:hypothetical protein
MTPHDTDTTMDRLLGYFPAMADETTERLALIREVIAAEADPAMVGEALKSFALDHVYARPSPAEIRKAIRAYIDRRTPGTALHGGPTALDINRTAEVREHAKRTDAFRADVQRWLGGISDQRISALLEAAWPTFGTGAFNALFHERNEAREWVRLSPRTVRCGKDQNGNGLAEPVGNRVNVAACLLYVWARDNAPEYIETEGGK